MIDLTETPIEIKISHDGKTVWINTHEKCVFRAEKIPELFIKDMRESKMNCPNCGKKLHYMFTDERGNFIVDHYNCACGINVSYRKLKRRKK